MAIGNIQEYMMNRKPAVQPAQQMQPDQQQQPQPEQPQQPQVMPRAPENSEGPGGITGHGQDPDFKLAPAPAQTPAQQWQNTPTVAKGTLPTFGTNAPSTDQINQYFQSMGVTPKSTTAQYWSSKWPELIARGKQLDPSSDGTAYANKFLSNEEDVTGSAAQTAKNMWGITPGQGGGAGGGMMGQMAQGGQGPIWDFLMNQMNQNKIPSTKDPIIASQTNAFDAAQERSNRDYLAQQAEQAGPQGNIGMERRMAAEHRGQATGAFQGQIMQQELNARRQEIQQALSGALGYLTEQQKMQLTQQLAQMDNALQYSRLGQDAYQFDQNDEFRRSPLAS